MGQQYLGEIRIVSFNFAPRGWALCNGQLLPINQNQALFSVLGTTYGGDGSPPFVYGQPGGEEMHTLITNEIPAHNHTPVASTQGANQASPSGNLWPTGPNQYATTPLDTPMAANAIGNNTGGQPHDNRAPYLVLNFIIATTGIFPSRN